MRSAKPGNHLKHHSLIGNGGHFLGSFFYNFPSLKLSISDFFTHGQMLYLHKLGNYTWYSCVIYANRRESFSFYTAFYIYLSGVSTTPLKGSFSDSWMCLNSSDPFYYNSCKQHKVECLLQWAA